MFYLPLFKVQLATDSLKVLIKIEGFPSLGPLCVICHICDVGKKGLFRFLEINAQVPSKMCSLKIKIIKILFCNFVITKFFL